MSISKLRWRAVSALIAAGATVPAMLSEEARAAARLVRGHLRRQRYLPGWRGVAVPGLMRRAAVVAGTAVVLLGPAVGVASAAGRAAAGTRPATGTRAVSGGTWGKAREVPSTATLNAGGNAIVTSVSCGAAGNCSAGGQYTDSSGSQAFVVSQVNGTWGKAKEVPGTAALNQGREAVVTSVSCASAGNCSAGGYYHDSSGRSQAFVVSQVNGTWGKAEEVPGTAALNTGNDAINSVSCSSAGNCSAGGYYTDSSGNRQAFVVSQVNGTWRKAKEVPAPRPSTRAAAAWRPGQLGVVRLGGQLQRRRRLHRQLRPLPGVRGQPGQRHLGHGEGSPRHRHAQQRRRRPDQLGVVRLGGQLQRRRPIHRQLRPRPGIRGQPGQRHLAHGEEVPGTATLNQARVADINSVSCASAGNCSAGGPIRQLRPLPGVRGQPGQRHLGQGGGSPRHRRAQPGG